MFDIAEILKDKWELLQDKKMVSIYYDKKINVIFLFNDLTATLMGKIIKCIWKFKFLCQNYHIFAHHWAQLEMVAVYEIVNYLSSCLWVGKAVGRTSAFISYINAWVRQKFTRAVDLSAYKMLYAIQGRVLNVLQHCKFA